MTKNQTQLLKLKCCVKDRVGELRRLRRSGSESREPGGNLNKRPAAQRNTRAGQGSQVTLGTGHPRSSQHTKPQSLVLTPAPSERSQWSLDGWQDVPELTGDSWCTGSGEVTLTEADLRDGPVGEPPAPQLDHPRSQHWAPPRGPTWAEVIPLIMTGKRSAFLAEEFHITTEAHSTNP